MSRPIRGLLISLALVLLLSITALAGCAPTATMSKAYEKVIALARSEIWQALITDARRNS